MRLRSEAKVGLIVFAAIVVLIAIYWFLGGLRLRSAAYRIHAVFPNAQKLNKGTEVRLAGVKIGMVADLHLTKDAEARIDIYIDKGINIPKDSTARITAGGFIGENYVEIAPGSRKARLKPGDEIGTALTVQPDQLMQQAGDLLSELQKSARGINEFLGDKEMMATVKGTITALRDASKSASEMTESAKKLMVQTTPQVSAIMANLDDATRAAGRSTAQLEAMMNADVRPNVKTIMATTGEAVKHLDESILQARELISAMRGKAEDVDSMLPKVEQSLDNINTATAQASQMLAKLNDASTGVKDLMTDTELQENLKKTVRNVAEASEQINNLAASVNRRFAPKPAKPARAQGATQSGWTSDSLWNTSSGDYRFDGYYTLAGENGSLYRAGGYNIGENTQAILQTGKALGSSATVRYGLYASRLGFGFDRRVGGKGLISADILRPNDPRMELRGSYPISDSLGIYAGTSDLFHTSSDDVLVGIRYHR